MKLVLPALFAVALVSGCQAPPRTLYYWGSYEGVTYLGNTQPDKFTPAVQVAKLQEDIQRAAAANATVNPGLHAHLGYLYAQLGQADLARKELETEKALFPESAPFIDRLLNQEKKP
jgi:hypothetical protein